MMPSFLAILPLHALTGGDSIAATYGLTKTITVARKWYTLDLRAQKIGKYTAATKLCSLPHATEAIEQKVHMEHITKSLCGIVPQWRYS